MVKLFVYSTVIKTKNWGEVVKRGKEQENKVFKY